MYNQTYKRYTIANDVTRLHYVRLTLNWGLAQRLGFISAQFPWKAIKADTTITTSTPVKEIAINSVQTIYIYSDIVAPQLVGDTRAQLLRIANVLNDAGDQTNIEFYRLHYLPILRQSFQYIEIDMRTDSGDKVPFGSYGRVVAVLHFRPKRNY